MLQQVSILLLVWMLLNNIQNDEAIASWRHFLQFHQKNLSSGRRSFLPPDNGPTMQRYENKNLRENDNHKCGRRFVRNAYPTICRQLLRFVSFQLFQGFATSLRTWPAVLGKTKTWQRTKSQQIWSECCAAPKAGKLVLAYFLNFELLLNLPPWGEWWIPGINAMKIFAENMLVVPKQRYE